MKLTIQDMLLLCLIMVCGCSNLPNAAIGNIEIPYPKTNGIIPLAFDNNWTYTHTLFDSAGNRCGKQNQLSLSIGNVYQRVGDSLQLRVSYTNDTVIPYCYEYKYDVQDTGLLLMNRTKGTALRGTYIIGKYTSTKKLLCNEPVLWLKYPADSGEKWTVIIENDTQEIQVMSIHATCYYVNNDVSVSPISFMPGCYVYKSEKGFRSTWMYFHESIGMLGFLEYEKGVLRRNGLLNSMHVTK